MSLYIGGSVPSSCYYNGEEVKSIYVNSTKVWESETEEGDSSQAKGVK